MKKKPDAEQSLFDREALPGSVLRRRRPLILPRYLTEEARNVQNEGPARDRAHDIILRWVSLEREGHLRKKETSLDADFLNEVFGEALGYKTATHSPDHYNLERQFSVPGVGTADGALGHFSPAVTAAPLAVIELKSAGTNLDKDKPTGRTPVQQCWDYLNALPDCPWGIVSNFTSFRLYHREKTPSRFEHFRLQELQDHRRFQEFYCLFSRNGLLPSRVQRVPRALRLLTLTDERQRQVGDELYDSYSANREALIHHLHTRHRKKIDSAIRIAQRLLDRIVFVAFCEDRGLLPARIIERTYRELPPLTKVTNPRWRNFLDLFHALDRGHRNLALEQGYDGGLFRHDPEVDELQLDDEWTDFFREIAAYDFRDEVNVDVLGHLFEKSITELEKLRGTGFFEGDAGQAELPGKMPKSARRKRFGIYYTPADFTTFIVQETLGRVIDDRLAKTAAAHGIAPDDPSSQADPAQRARYGQACLQTLREVKVCDPACGSGAFLIQAYDLLEQRYLDIIDDLSDSDPSAAETLSDGVGDMILGENLYGVDVSAEAVEITQLALWIRSARRGKTLADLSRNIICANSLVTDPSVDARAIDWRGGFPQVFSRENPGFDCVIGNPPWERMKLQEREFFAFSAPDIAEAVSAAERRSLLANLEKRHPDLFARYREARARADATLAHVRSSGEFPLTAKGDINTYALFAELARKIVAPMGRVGILVPSGIASDKTTKDFFAELMKDRALVSLYDFENREGLFVDLHRSFKFCTLIFSGSDVKGTTADFVFFAHEMRDLADSTRHVSLSAKDLALLNPNTRTCPIFRSRRDAELTNAIYRKVPVLLEKARGDAGNPWGIRFVRMFDQTNDAELFHTSERLMKMGCKLKGNRWTRGKKTYLPLYEAKMIQAYDHRAASVVIDVKNWMRQGQAEPTSLVCHQNPDFLPQPRWWVEESRVDEVLEAARSSAYLCFKDVTSPTNQRTMIAALVPRAGIVNSAPLLLTSNHVAPRRLCCLLANLNSFVLDFVARQKVGNVHLNFFIVEQLPVLPPDAYADRCAWNARQRLEKWISDRVLKLTCTAADMRPLAEACGMSPPVHKWKPAERAELSAELDAAYFLLYGVKRRDAEYILSTFTGTRRRDESEIGEYRTAHLILDAFDRLSQT